MPACCQTRRSWLPQTVSLSCFAAGKAGHSLHGLRPAGYLNLLSQLTKVGDYDEATFKGEREQGGRESGAVASSLG